MPKLKTHSGAKKRFNLTENGKVKRAEAEQQLVSIEAELKSKLLEIKREGN